MLHPLSLLLVIASSSLAADGNRLAYLDEPLNPYYPHRNFPKLITPQWVGEEGVEASSCWRSTTCATRPSTRRFCGRFWTA